MDIDDDKTLSKERSISTQEREYLNDVQSDYLNGNNNNHDEIYEGYNNYENNMDDLYGY